MTPTTALVCVTLGLALSTAASLQLDPSAVEAFVNSNRFIVVPNFGAIDLRCITCRSFIHPGYFTQYGGLDGSELATVVFSVHACRVDNVTYRACAVERRGFPLTSRLLAAIERRITEFSRPLFVDLPNATVAVAQNGVAPSAFVVESDDPSRGISDVAPSDDL